MTTKPGEMAFMYEVVETWGDVPEQIASMVGDPNARLMYPENRGIRSTQEWMKNYKHAGGWAMERRGAAIAGADQKIDRYIDEADVAAEFDDQDACEHLTSTSVDDAPSGPDKVWECDTCGWRHRSIDAHGRTRMVPA